MSNENHVFLFILVVMVVFDSCNQMLNEFGCESFYCDVNEDIMSGKDVRQWIWL